MPIEQSLLNKIQLNDPNFTELKLTYQHLTIEDINELVNTLKGNPYITELDLTGNLFGNDCIELLIRIPHLISINLSGNQITDKNIYLFNQCLHLRKLDLSYNQITDIGIEFLAENKTLTTLVLNGNKIITPDKLANTNLISLSLKNNEIKEQGIQGFVDNKTLKQLYLDDNLLDGDNIYKIVKDNVIEELSLNYNHLTDKHLIAIINAANPNLTSLSIAHNEISDNGMEVLKNFIPIKKLSLAGNRINKKGILLLLSNPSLIWLDLSYNQIDDYSFCEVPENTSLQYLDLSYNQINEKGTVSIVEKLPKLDTLFLNYNNVGDQGAVTLAASHLTYLDLTGNGISFEGAAAFSENNSITTLILNSNNLGDPGAMLLAHNKTCTKLMVCYNRIGNIGALALAKNKKIEELNLNYNLIDQKTKDILRKEPHVILDLVCEPTQTLTFVDRLQGVFSQNLLCIINANNRLQFCNPAFVRLLGYQEYELYNSSVLQFLHPEDRLENNILNILNYNLPSMNLDNRFLCKDGSYRVIRWNAQLKGDCIYAAGTDISEQKKSEKEFYLLQQQKEVNHMRSEEVEKYNRELRDFIANLSHEIRNPLSAAYSSIAIMEEQLNELLGSIGKIDPEILINKLNTFSTYLGDLKQCIEYPVEILNNNLDIAKISEKKLKLKIKPLNFNELILDIVRILKYKAEQKKIRFLYELPENTLWVESDAARIKQILVNLVNNAIKFTEHGEVKIILTYKESAEDTIDVEIKVIDTGIGMTKEETSLLFNRYSQVNITIGNQYGGTGLGLFISKELASLMGGYIEVDSKKDLGTTVICHLKCKKFLQEKILVSGKEEQMPLISPISIFKNVKPIVLVVEDNLTNRRILCNLLKNNFICIEAINGKDAVDKFQAQHFDIILMDMMMPVMNGIEATQIIRRIEREKNSPKVPIIAVTANALEQDEQQAMAAGIDCYIIKPYGKEKLFNTMYSLLSQYDFQKTTEKTEENKGKISEASTSISSESERPYKKQRT